MLCAGEADQEHGPLPAMIGRVIRPAPGKDHWANWLRDPNAKDDVVYFSGNLAIKAENNGKIQALRRDIQEHMTMG
jgi:hypothetical protein